MKNHIQTIVNVCLAICVTLLIYQNNQQQDRIDFLDERLGLEPFMLDEFGNRYPFVTVNKKLRRTSYELEMHDLLIEFNKDRLEDLETTTKNIEDYLAENFGN